MDILRRTITPWANRTILKVHARRRAILVDVPDLLKSVAVNWQGFVQKVRLNCMVRARPVESALRDAVRERYEHVAGKGKRIFLIPFPRP